MLDVIGAMLVAVGVVGLVLLVTLFYIVPGASVPLSPFILAVGVVYTLVNCITEKSN